MERRKQPARPSRESWGRPLQPHLSHIFRGSGKWTQACKPCPWGHRGPHRRRHGGDHSAPLSVRGGWTDGHPVHEAGAETPETALRRCPGGPGPRAAAAGGRAGRAGLVPTAAALAPGRDGHAPAGPRHRLLGAAGTSTQVPQGQSSGASHRRQLQLRGHRGAPAVGDAAGPGLPEGPRLPRRGAGDHPGRLLLHLLQGAAGRRGLPAGPGHRPARHPRALQAHHSLPRGAGAAGEPAVALRAGGQLPRLVGQQLPGRRGAPGGRRGGGGAGAGGAAGPAPRRHPLLLRRVHGVKDAVIGGLDRVGGGLAGWTV